MTDRIQFEAMLEALINEDQETAKEIFHNIVVAKSREIYEELLAEDFDLEEAPDGRKPGEEDDSEVDEAFGADDEAGDEEPADDEGDSEEGEGDDDYSTDDGEDSGEDLSDEEQTDRILDLEDALDELKAEFEQMMAGDEGEGDEFGGDEFGGDMGGEEDLPFDETDVAGAVDPSMDPNAMMEYVNKVSPPKHGDDGANTKSIVAGKNDMGGTTANIVKGGTSTTGGTQGGLLKPSTKEDNAGNVNVPGGKSATKLSPVSKGHGAERKQSGGDNGQNKKSIIGSRG